MEFSFQNLGNIKKANVELKDLTIICGPNNSSKTLLSYSIFITLAKFIAHMSFGVEEDIVHELKEKRIAKLNRQNIKKNLKKHVENATSEISEKMSEFFGAPSDFFRNLNIEFKMDVEKYENKNFEIKYENIVFEDLKLIMELDNETGDFIFSVNKEFSDGIIEINQIKNLVKIYLFFEIYHSIGYMPYSITSERTGIELFYNYNIIFDLLLRSRIKPEDYSELNKKRPKFSLPIQNNIEITSMFESIVKEKSMFVNFIDEFQYVIDTMDELLDGGSFSSKHNSIIYTPGVESNEPIVPIYLAASSIKSLFLLNIFIRHKARFADMVIIDEPELSLHPDKQVLMAKLIARLINAGIKVLLTTHSDFLILEINNLIAVQNTGNEKERLMKKFNYEKVDLIDSKRVSAYCTDTKGKISKMLVNESGIDAELFNSIIIDQNRKTHEIRFYEEDDDED